MTKGQFGVWARDLATTETSVGEFFDKFGDSLSAALGILSGGRFAEIYFCIDGERQQWIWDTKCPPFVMN